MKKFDSIATKQRRFMNMVVSVIVFTNSLKKMGINFQFAVGGSLAANMWGIPIEREIHDIDIIVPKGCINIIKLMFDDGLFATNVTPEASSDDELDTNHVAYKFNNQYIFDFIEDNCEGLKNSTLINNVFYIKPKSLYNAKKHYNRLKDRTDRDVIKTWLETNDPDSYKELFESESHSVSSEKPSTIGDIDALKKLREKLSK